MKGHGLKQNEWIKTLRSIITGAAAGICVCALLLCLASLIIVKLGTLPTDMLPIITIAIGAMGAFCAGYVSVAICRKRGVLTGLAAAAGMSASAFVTSMVTSNTDDLAGNLIKCGVFMLFGSIGGVVRVNKRQAASRRPRQS